MDPNTYWVTITKRVCLDPVENEHAELEVEILCYLEPVIQARKKGHPDSWTPEEGGTFEILETSWKGGGPFKGLVLLNEKEKQEVRGLVEKAVAEAIANAQESHAVERYLREREDF